MIINDLEKVNWNVVWSIFSDKVNYIQYDRGPEDYYRSEARALEPIYDNRMHYKLKKIIEKLKT